MTLFRQLLLYACITLACLCTGLWLGELKRTRDFLVNQLESHAQDTATALGLSLTALTSGVDVPAMESMISALFDRGYYRQIQLRDVEGTLLIDRQAPISLARVPAWFVRLVPLTAPRATSLVMDGWRQAGEVSVESHPGYAYQTLWAAARDQALAFALTALAVAVLGGLGLRSLLKPLGRVEEQALALCDRRFFIQETIPRTRELRRVVLVMNRMTTRIREMFDEQTAVADTLLQRTYQDTLTATGNRRYLEGQVKTRLAGKKGEVKGSFLLVKVGDLQALNLHKGYQAGDQLLREIAAIIQQVCHDLPEAVVSRLGGGDFALLLPNAGEGTAARAADAILDHIRHHAATSLPDAGIVAAGGGVIYERPASFGDLLARADTALGQALYNNDGGSVFVPLADGDSAMPAAKGEWKGLLEYVLAQRAVTFHHQPTVSHADRERILYHEILSRVVDPAGRVLSVGLFVPMAERLGLMPALDRLIIERLLEEPLAALTPPRVSVNLSPVSLADADFRRWLEPQLAAFKARGVRVNFEFPEFRTLRHSELIRDFATTVKTHGHRIGIDHFGMGLMHFGYLRSLLPDYVKIDRAIVDELHGEQSDSYFYITSLCSVAHSLDIKVIVEGIETETQWQTLAPIRLDAVQGFWIGKPEPLIGTRA